MLSAGRLIPLPSLSVAIKSLHVQADVNDAPCSACRPQHESSLTFQGETNHEYVLSLFLR